MQHRDMRKILSRLYVLTLLFIGLIYMQDAILADPDAITTLNNATSQFETSAISAQSFIGFHLSGESAVIALIIVTIFFGFAWRVSRSRSYEM